MLRKLGGGGGGAAAAAAAAAERHSGYHEYHPLGFLYQLLGVVKGILRREQGDWMGYCRSSSSSSSSSSNEAG